MKNNLTYWSILQSTTESIRHSETKAGIMISAYGVLSALTYINSANIFDLATMNPVTTIICILSLICGISSLYFALRCISPRFLKSEGNSIIFFGIIGSKYPTPEDYYEKSKEIIDDHDKANLQIAEQIHINSKIAIRKYNDIGKSIRLFVANIVMTLLALLLELFT